MQNLEQIPEVTFLRAWARVKLAQARGPRGDRGVTTAEWVIIVAIVAAAAIAIATVVMSKFKSKANNIPTE